MTTTSTLNSGWTLRAVDPEPGTRAAELPERIASTVPGTVHTDLLAADLIVDPYLDLNELADPWIGHTTWAYETDFEGSEPGAARAELVFDGLDTVATIILNDRELGSTANQHRTYRFDVTDAIRPGSNHLEVVFHSAWEYAERQRAELGQRPNAYPTPFNFIRKMAANFGWDWGPQLVTAGIWKEVRLETTSIARLLDPRLSTTVDGADGVLTVTSRVAVTSAAASHELVLRVTCAGEIAEIRVGTATDSEGGIPAPNAVVVVARIPDVRLWWPRGLGGQSLYGVAVELVNGDEIIDRWERRTGFRTMVLDTADDETGSAFTFVVNGTSVFVRGANWIPDDCFPSRLTRERYRERIEQAVGANLNLLRVWGGGIYERDEFYDLCDELGVMTWQDFLFACAAYPEESPLREEVEAEARDNVARLAGHPSLMLWNGCNENIWGWFDWGWQEPLGDRTWGLGYYTKLLPAIVAEIDPATPYWPGSPYSGTPTIHANDSDRGNVHYWDVWNRIDYTAYAGYQPRFVSEFGFQGPPTWSTLTRAIHDDPMTPKSPGMLLHQKATDGNGKLARGMAPHLPEPRDIEEWHYLTQLNQSRAIEFGIEHFRSQRPHCMGTIVWQLNDCWPVTSWAAIDGDGRRKPLWYGLRRANRERLATLQPAGQRPIDDDGLRLVLMNDGVGPWDARGSIRRVSVDGAVLAEQAVAETVAGSSSASIDLVPAVGVADDPERELLVVVFGDLVTTRLFVEEKELALTAAGLHLEIGDWRDGRHLVRISSAAVARGVTIAADRLHPEAWSDASDLTVLPGEPVEVSVFSPEPLDPERLASAPVLWSLDRLRQPVALATPALAR